MAEEPKVKEDNGLNTLEFPLIASQCDVANRSSDPVFAEKQMWAAVMRNAVQWVRGDRMVQNAQERRRERRRAFAWFKSNRISVGSFVWVCGVLELDAARLRAGVMELVVTSAGE